MLLRIISGLNSALCARDSASLETISTETTKGASAPKESRRSFSAGGADTPGMLYSSTEIQSFGVP